MPSRITTPAEGWSQNKQRGIALFFDQHRSESMPDGRPWWCYTERPADGAAVPMPVGELMPHGWDAPWLPEAKYMNMSMGSLATNRFRIAYERMISDYRADAESYYRRAAQEAAAINLPIPEFGEAVTWKLRAVVGEPPKSSKIPEAALAGDRWLLGFTTEPNEQLQRLLYTGDSRIAPPSYQVPISELPRSSDELPQTIAEVEANRRKNKGSFKKTAGAAVLTDTPPAVADVA